VFLPAASDPPVDSYLGLVLIALALLGGIVMTVVVIVRNRRGDPGGD